MSIRELEKLFVDTSVHFFESHFSIRPRKMSDYWTHLIILRPVGRHKSNFKKIIKKTH